MNKSTRSPRGFGSGRCGWFSSNRVSTSRSGQPSSRFRPRFGCTAEKLRKWVRQAERDLGLRAGVSSDERERLKALERENRELRRANAVVPKISAVFAQAELDRRSK